MPTLFAYWRCLSSFTGCNLLLCHWQEPVLNSSCSVGFAKVQTWVIFFWKDYFSSDQFCLLCPNWLHKSCLVWMRNVSVLSSVIFTLIYQFIKIYWCRTGAREWQHKSGLQHNDPNQLEITGNVMMSYVSVLLLQYSIASEVCVCFNHYFTSTTLLPKKY